MTSSQDNPKALNPRPIRRQQIYVGLVLGAVLAAGVTACNEAAVDTGVSEAQANESVPSVFYQTVAQCEADTKKQQSEYSVLTKAYEAGELSQPPAQPFLKPEDCGAQMAAAKKTHQDTAPVYNSLAECESEGVKCESAAASDQTAEQAAGYRPVYGGSYFNPFLPAYTYIMLSGIRHPIYESRPVYQSSTPGRVVTPYGRSLPQPSTGLGNAPRHTSFAPPPRPAGTAAKGTIQGRSRQGFGSSYKSTGSGGK
jgi:uncharacterized protein YgiB involved in biofilm formation